MYLLFTCMLGESYRRRLRCLLLYLCYLFRELINSLVCLLNISFSLSGSSPKYRSLYRNRRHQKANNRQHQEVNNRQHQEVNNNRQHQEVNNRRHQEVNSNRQYKQANNKQNQPADNRRHKEPYTTQRNNRRHKETHTTQRNDRRPE